MGSISWNAASNVGRHVKFGVEGNYLTVDEPWFCGECAKSPSGRYTLGWSEAATRITDGFGVRPLPGNYVLLDGTRVEAYGTLHKPGRGKVSDVGIFILTDMADTESMITDCMVFSPAGKVILSQRFRADICSTGISSNGALVACQTWMSDLERDDFVVCILDVRTGREVGRFPGATQELSLRFTDQSVVLGYGAGQEARYALDGRNLD